MENENNNPLQLVNTGVTQFDPKKKQEENIEISLTQIFNLPQTSKIDAQALANRYQMRHGMMSSVPIICKSSKCPYYEVCQVPIPSRIAGTRCLQEIGIMLARFESLCTELGVEDTDSVDLGMIKDIVDIELLMVRADNKIALTSDILVQTIAQVDHQGKEHYEDVVDPVITLKLNLLDRKMKLLEKLNSTRKDKAADMKKKKDPSIKAANLMAKVKMMAAMAGAQGIVDNDNSIVKETSIEYTEIEMDGEYDEDDGDLVYTPLDDDEEESI